MRHTWIPLLLAAGCSPAATTSVTASTPAAAPAPASSPGHAGPEEAVQAYFAGSDRCSSQLLRSAFHPAAHMWWEDGGAMRSRTMLAWWQITDAAKPCTPALERRLTVLDREGPMALVQASSRYATFRFHDLLLVVHTPRGWIIADKIFEKLGPDEEPAQAGAADESAVRQVLDAKIGAALEHDPALLARSHLDDCIYSRAHKGGTAYERESVSEWAARYAERRQRGEDGRAARWQITKVSTFGKIAAAKLDIASKGGTRYIDHLLLLRVGAGGDSAWRIAAAVWGEP